MHEPETQAPQGSLECQRKDVPFFRQTVAHMKALILLGRARIRESGACGRPGRGGGRYLLACSSGRIGANYLTETTSSGTENAAFNSDHAPHPFS
jgi:hypothetical protein